MIDKQERREREGSQGNKREQWKEGTANRIQVRFKLNLTVLHSIVAVCSVFLEGIKMRPGPLVMST